MKKALFVILVVTLVVTMLPAVFAAEDENKSLEYLINSSIFVNEDYKNKQFGFSSSSDLNLMQLITSYNQLDSSTQPWLMKNIYKCDAGNMTGQRLQFAATQANIAAGNAWMVFKIQIPKGIYDFDVNIAEYLYGPGIDVYLFPSDGINSAGPAQFNPLTPVGHFDTYSEKGNGNTFINKDVATVVIDKEDDYFVVLRLTDSGHYNTGSKNREILYLAKFIFTETPPSSVTFDSETVALTKGGTATVKATAKDANGNAIAIADVSYKSEDSSIATVDEKTGEITALKDGKTNIIASVDLYPTISAKIPVNVQDYTHEYIFNTTVLTEETITALTVAEADKNNGYYGGVLRKLSLIADDYKYIDETKSDLWAVSSLGGTVGNIAGDRFNIGIPLSSIGLDNPVSRFVLKLKVKYPGIYDLGIACGAHATKALSADVYMIKADGVTTLSNAIIRSNKKVGSIDGSIGSSSGDVLGVVNLEAEDYYLIFDLWNGMPKGDNKHNIYPTSAKLTLHEGEIVEADESVALESKKLSFAVGLTDSAEITVNGIAHNGNLIYSFDRSDEITVEAGVAPEGKRFKAWVQGTADNGIWKSGDEKYTFKIMTHTYLTAVYEDVPTEDAYVVEYYNENGKYFATKEADGTTPVLPNTPTLTGYTFDMWTVDGETKFDNSSILTEKLTRAVAKYTANDIAANNFVKYNGQDKTGKFGTDVVLSDAQATHWIRDGRVVAYGTDYTHYIWDATSIYCSYAPIENNPVVVIEDTLVDGANMIEYDAGNKKIIEVGILFGTATVDVSSCRYKATSQWNKNHGQFTASRNSDEAYARGYLIYDDGGVYKVIYTDAVAIK